MRCEDHTQNPIIYLFHEGKTELGYLQGLYGAWPCLGGEMVYEM